MPEPKRRQLNILIMKKLLLVLAFLAIGFVTMSFMSKYSESPPACDIIWQGCEDEIMWGQCQFGHGHTQSCCPIPLPPDN